MERVSDRRRRGPLNVGLSPDTDAALVVPDDGLYTPTIKPHSLDKIRAHNRFARMFATSMREKWPQLAYIGLYAGAGHAHVDGTDRIVQTSALAVLRQPHPFTHYVYVDKDPTCAEALARRCAAVSPNANVTIIGKDVNECIPEVRAALPSWSPRNGLLSFCFVDPFDTKLRFETIRALADLRIDFLILLMLGNDARRNLWDYFHDPDCNRIAEFVDRSDWRDEFRKDGKIVRCVLRLFDEAMQRVGYPQSKKDTILPIYAHGTKVLQYMLAFYSKSAVGMTLWRESIKSLTRLDPQTRLEL